MPYRNSPHREIEIVMSFDYLHVIGPMKTIKKEILCSKLVIKNIFM